MLTMKSVVKFGLFLQDVIQVLKNVSISLQRKDSSLYECNQKLRETSAQLAVLQQRLVGLLSNFVK